MVVCVFQASILYYCQEKYSNSVVGIATEAQRKFNNPIFGFFRAYGVLLQGKRCKLDTTHN